MYKNIKELGLELIELEDQFLLVDNSEKITNSSKIGYCYNSIKKTWSQDIVLFHGAMPGYHYEGFKRIVVSTKQLEGLPLLVIEDETKKEALKAFPVSVDTRNNITKDINSLERTPFEKGYNKAKELYKYTEEQLCEVWLRACKGDDLEEILSDLNQKQLWVEVEVFTETVGTNEFDSMEQDSLRPKTTDNKIKAVWK